MPFHWFTNRYFTSLTLVQSFNLWQVWAAQQYHTYLLIAGNKIEEVVVTCRYDSLEERAAEVDLLRRLGLLME